MMNNVLTVSDNEVTWQKGLFWTGGNLFFVQYQGIFSIVYWLKLPQTLLTFIFRLQRDWFSRKLTRSCLNVAACSPRSSAGNFLRAYWYRWAASFSRFFLYRTFPSSSNLFSRMSLQDTHDYVGTGANKLEINCDSSQRRVSSRGLDDWFRTGAVLLVAAMSKMVLTTTQSTTY